MTQYAGLCVGGPYAGRVVHHHTNRLKVQVRPPAVLDPAPVRYTIEADANEHTYNWLPIGGIGLWCVDTMTLEEVMNDLCVAYVEKHHVAQ